jgi:hypothetical protein
MGVERVIIIFSEIYYLWHKIGEQVAEEGKWRQPWD